MTRPLDETICFCAGVTVAMIKEAIDNGAKTVDDVKLVTRAGTTCGICNPILEEVVAEILAENKN